MTAALAEDYEDDWVPLNQAAREFGVAASTLARWAREGKLLRLYHGGRVYTTRESMSRYRMKQAAEAEARRVALEKAKRKRK